MSRAPRMQPPTRFIYVIGPSTGWQKVGIATDPQTRLAALRTASSLELMLHAAVAVPFNQAHAVEREAHLRLARFRVRAEWFDVTAADAVAAVHKAAGPWIGRAEPAHRVAPIGSRAPMLRDLPLFAAEPRAASVELTARRPAARDRA